MAEAACFMLVAAAIVYESSLGVWVCCRLLATVYWLFGTGDAWVTVVAPRSSLEFSVVIIVVAAVIGCLVDQGQLAALRLTKGSC